MMELTMGLVGRLGGWLFVQAPLVLLGAAVTAWVLRDASASTRHRVWSAAVVAVLVLPLLTLVVPRVGVSLPRVTDRLVAELRAPGVLPMVDVAVPDIAPIVVAVPDVAPVVVDVPDVAPIAVAIGRAATPRPARIQVPGALRASTASFDVSFDPGGPVAFALPPGLPFGLPPVAIAILVWATVAAGLMVRLFVSALRVRAQERRLDAASVELSAAVHGVARAHGIWNLRVLTGGVDAMPSTWGTRRPVLLLPASAEYWSPARLDAVVRHELAHVRRADTRLQLLADLVCALHWFDPLAWYAAHRMRVERELACDDEVLAAGARASDYADELVSLARSLRPAPVGVAMAGTGGLRTRIESLLDARRPRGTSTAASAAIRLVAALGAVLVAMLTPQASVAHEPDFAWDVEMPFPEPVEAAAFAEHLHAVRVPERVIATVTVDAPLAIVQDATMCWSSVRGGSSSTRRNDDEFRLEWERADCSVDIRIDGELRFNSDFTDIAGFAGRGRATFEERDGARSRRAEITPEGSGIARRWLVDGREAPWNAEAARWFEAVLLNTLRTGAYAEERADWMLRERGVDALLQELPLLRGDWARGQYYRAAFRADLSAGDVARLTREAAADIDSDHTLQTVLEAVVEHHSLTNGTVRAAYIAAAGTIDSDHSRGRALEAALMQPGLPPNDIAAVLDAVSGIDSDHEKMTLLIALAEQHTLTPALRESYLRVVASIESDHSTARAARALFETDALSDAETALALEVARGIESDHELSQLLIQLPVDLNDERQRRTYEAAIAGIESDHALGETLRALMENGDLGPVTAGVVLRGSHNIDSDHELGEVLKEFVERGGLTDATRAEFERAMTGIGSRHTREQVEQAMRGR